MSPAGWLSSESGQTLGVISLLGAAVSAMLRRRWTLQDRIAATVEAAVERERAREMVHCAEQMTEARAHASAELATARAEMKLLRRALHRALTGLPAEIAREILVDLHTHLDAQDIPDRS